MLVIISGPSGSGKGTVVKGLRAENGYALSVSVTTRQARKGEIDGRDYFFKTEDEFRMMRENGELLEHAFFVNSFYGTPMHYVETQIQNDKIVVLEIEVNGALQVREKFPQAILIFLMPPTFEELANRLKLRGTEDDVTIEARLKKAKEEIPLIERYHYLVINDEVEKAITKIDAIVTAERMRPARSADAIRAFL